jgi:hypothetical protein
MTGGPGSGKSLATDPLAERDSLIESSASKFRFDPPWDEPGRLFTCIEVATGVEIRTDPTRAGYRYLWFDVVEAEKVLDEKRKAGDKAIHAVLAMLLPQLPPSMFGHSGPKTYRWIEADGKPPCSIPRFRAGGVTAWTSPTTDVLAEQVHKVQLPAQLDSRAIDKLATLGRWRVVAEVENDAFRQFMWCFAGIEVVSRWADTLVRKTLVRSISADPAHSTVLRELFWPTIDDGREPQRNLVATFAAMALALSPDTAEADVSRLKDLAAYRNKIHGGTLEPDAAPVAEARELWRRYSRLVAEFLQRRG